MAGGEECQWALTERRTLWGGGTLERGHGALLEPLAQLGDALGGVGALASPIDATELVIGQTAVHGWCQRGDGENVSEGSKGEHVRSVRC